MEGSFHKVLAVPESESNRDPIRDVQPDGRDTVRDHQLPTKIEVVRFIPRCRGERNAAPQTRESQDEGQCAGEPNCPDGRLGFGVHPVEELVPRDSSITGESVHHTGIGCDGKHATTRLIVSHKVAFSRGNGLPAEVHAPDDNHHQNDGTLGAYCIEEDLGHRLTCWGVERSVQILNRKQQPEDQEPAQNRGDADGHDNTNRPGHGGIVSFLRHLHPRFNLQRRELR